MGKRYYPAVSLAKFFFSICIIGQHTRPLDSIPALGQMSKAVFAIGVPFFFFCSGYFLTDNAEDGAVFTKKRMRYFLRIALIYLIGSLLYLPFVSSIWFDGAPISGEQVLWYLKNKVALSSFEHLWYLYALFFGGILYLLLWRFFGMRITLALASAVYVVGVLLHSVLPPPDAAVRYSTWIGVQSVVFSGFPMIAFGGALRYLAKTIRPRLAVGAGIAAGVVYLGECYAYTHLPDRMPLLFFAMPLLVASMFALLVYIPLPHRKIYSVLQSASTWNYVIHFWFILAPRHFFGIAMPESGFVLFMFVTACTCAVSLPLGALAVRSRRA